MRERERGYWVRKKIPREIRESMGTVIWKTWEKNKQEIRRRDLQNKSHREREIEINVRDHREKGFGLQLPREREEERKSGERGKEQRRK